MPQYKKRSQKSNSQRSNGFKRRLRPVSASQKRRLQVYERLKKAFLALHPVCAICSQRKSTDVHHRKGRGPYLLDETTWMALCRPCHDHIHQNVGWSLTKGYLIARLSKT